MIDSLGNVPAYVAGRFGDILACNRIAHALLAGHIERSSPPEPGRTT